MRKTVMMSEKPENRTMRTLFGMILGAALTVALIYAYDSSNSNNFANANARTIVNWDVAAADWQSIKTRTRASWTKLTEG